MNHHLAFLAGLLALAGSAQAHVVLEYQVAPAGSAYKATFKVTHGCGDAPTRQVSVAIPAGVTGARPMPKPGWAVDIQRGRLAEPVTSHGRTVTDDVTRITWTARSAADMLPGDQYDEFVLVGQLPDRAGPLYWPLSQACEPGRLDWTAVPAPGQSPADLKNPAAVLELLPADGPATHHH